MSPGLDVHLRYDRGIPVLVLTGEIDTATASHLRRQGRHLTDTALGGRDDAPPGNVARAPVLVLDASDVTFIDSAGLGALITIFKCARSHRAGLSIAGANLQIQRLMASTGLDRVLMLHASSTQAVDAAVGVA